MDWAKEDKRIKPFVGVEDPGLSDEEKAAMLKRFAQPLSRAIEYLASLPDYHPKPFETLPQVPFKVKYFHFYLKNTKKNSTKTWDLLRAL